MNYEQAWHEMKEAIWKLHQYSRFSKEYPVYQKVLEEVAEIEGRQKTPEPAKRGRFMPYVPAVAVEAEK